jgi:predicted MPP superfamily phosphohydrolase
MHRFLLFVFLIILVPDLYIYCLYVIRKTRRIWLRLLYWLPTLLLAIGYMLLMHGFARNELALHPTLFGKFAIVLLLFTVPKIIFVLFSLPGLVCRLFLHWKRDLFALLGVAMSVVTFCAILYGATVGVHNFEVKEVSYSHVNVPKAFDGYRIALLSDIHLGSWAGREDDIKKMVEMVNEQHPDLILFVGDLVNHRSIELDDFQPILASLHAKDGVYSVLGNHDYGTYFRWRSPEEEAANLDSLKAREAAMGWQMLNNAHTVLHHNGDSIALIGVENDGRPPFPKHGDLKKASAGTDGMFRILMSHDPTHWRREVLPKSTIELMLSGHTHAMQSIVFGYSPAALIYKEWGGMYKQDDRSLYVNIGIGYVGLPFRLGANPEITLITLHSK